MNSGNEEANVFKNLDDNIKYIKSKLDLDKINTNQNTDMATNSSSIPNNIFSRVRVDEHNPIVVPTVKNDNHYGYSTTENSTNISSNSAFAAVLMVAEILALIILVTLITFIALNGLS